MLDVYYAEMSYEKVDQQMAFTVLSLLSEVGGFLGLWLGASILTLCEVIDYLFSRCRSPVISQKKVQSVYTKSPDPGTEKY